MLTFILLCIAAIIFGLLASFCIHKLRYPALPVIGYSITGNAKGKPIVFIHGWPDTSSMWKKQIEYFQRQHLCINITLPNYDKHNIQNPWGYPPQNVSKAIANQIEHILQSKYPKWQKEGVILMVHDWGSIIGQLIMKHDGHLVSKAVIIDVGDAVPNENVAFIAMVAYQLFNVFCFLLPTLFGDWLMRGFTKYVEVPAAEEERRSGKKTIHVGMNYLYLYLYYLKVCKPEVLRTTVPNCPTFFAAGNWILQPWHTKKWKKVLMEREDCVYKQYKNAEHWVMLEQADAFNKDIAAWL